MLLFLLMRRVARAAAGPRAACLLGITLVVAGSMSAADALAQRPFEVYDPFYRTETARRAFFDGIAVSGEISYQAAGVVHTDGLSLTHSDPLGLSFRLDYQLAQRVDLSAFWDARGSNAGRSVSVSWVGLKYYWTVDNSDYSFRLAVDPASDGRVGFPQMDLAFLSTRLLSPVFSNDVALGIRHVRMRFHQVLHPSPDAPPLFLNTQALGMELHLMWSYDVIFDPAKSNLFISLVGEGGQYTLIDSPLFLDPGFETPAQSAPEVEKGTRQYYRGGVVWARTGIEYNRPSYQIIPFLSAPVKQWQEAEWQKARVQFGFRLMLR